MLHTPDADELFLTRLKQVGMRGLNDSIVLVELGTTWGTRGRRQPSTRGSPHLPDLREDEEVRYFVHWVHTVAFPNRLVLWITACGCDQRLRHRGLTPLMRAMWYEVQKEYKEAAVMVDKCILSTAEFGFPAGHGCRGPLLNVLGQILHATLEQVPEKYLYYFGGFLLLVWYNITPNPILSIKARIFMWNKKGLLAERVLCIP